MALDLVNTTVLLLALSLLQGFIVRVFGKDSVHQQLVSGLLFAGACLFAMTIQISVGSGSAIDARIMILCLGSLFTRLVLNAWRADHLLPLIAFGFLLAIFTAGFVVIRVKSLSRGDRTESATH